MRGDRKHLFNTSLVSRNEDRPHVQKPLGYNKLTMHEMGNQSSRYAEFKRMCNSQKSVRVHWPRDPGAIETCYIFASTSISLQNKNFTFMEAAVTKIDDLFFYFVPTYRQLLEHLSFLSPENANEEERKEFMDEIELMKKVGKHQNVLSFFGCWTTTKPILLMVEYIAHGDLLQWLRRKRSQVSKISIK